MMPMMWALSAAFIALIVFTRPVRSLALVALNVMLFQLPPACEVGRTSCPAVMFWPRYCAPIEV
jgi:hypothetical protein